MADIVENDKKTAETAKTSTKDNLNDYIENSLEYDEYIKNLAEYEKEAEEAFKNELSVFNNTFVKKTLAKSIKNIQYKKVNPDFYVEQQINKIVFTFNQNMDILKYSLKDIMKLDKKPVFKH